MALSRKCAGFVASQILHKKTSTHLLTVLTTYVILHAEQRKQHISPSGEIFLIQEEG